MNKQKFIKWFFGKTKKNRLISLISLLMLSIVITFSGFHNLDLAQNEDKMQKEMNIKLLKHNISDEFNYVETNFLGKHIKLDRLYINGITTLLLGILFLGLISFSLGSYIAKLKIK